MFAPKPKGKELIKGSKIPNKSNQINNQLLSTRICQIDLSKEKVGLTRNVSLQKKPVSSYNVQQSKHRRQESSITFTSSKTKPLSYAATPTLEKREKSNEKTINLHLQSKLKNFVNSCAASPAYGLSKELHPSFQGRKLFNESDKKKSSSLVRPTREIEPFKPIIKKPISLKANDKKKPVSKPLVFQQNLVQDLKKQLNSSAEDELFRECLGVSKQNFEFEKRILSKCYQNLSNGTQEAKTNKISNKLENKLKLPKKDSFDTIAGLTTSSSSRCRGSRGVFSDFFDH